MAIDRAHVSELARFYRHYLTADVLAFWESRVADADGPGHLHLFDRRGELAGTDKYVWCQGRQTYMFGALYRELDARPQWLELARRGRDVLVNNAHAGSGRFHYQLDRDGNVVDASRSWLTDAFALMGLCEYAAASGRDDDRALIESTYEALERHFYEPSFDEFHHFQFEPDVRYHALPMIAVGVAPSVRAVLGEQRITAWVNACLKQILWTFAKDEHEVLFEAIGPDGEALHTDKGRTINPGHALESMWFCLEEGLHRGDETVIDRAGQVTAWAYENGLDREQGGLFAFTDPSGNMPPGGDRPNAFGEYWDTKIWWVHAEALYALALAALVKDDAAMWQRFLAQHDYWQRTLADRECGEWYAYLERDGQVRVGDKGTWIKSAFHIPRALMKLVQVLERYGA